MDDWNFSIRYGLPEIVLFMGETISPNCFEGLTSIWKRQESAVGFILVDTQTNYSVYKQSSATSTAQGSAEGKVQEKLNRRC
jgi:hypothetical protein